MISDLRPMYGDFTARYRTIYGRKISYDLTRDIVPDTVTDIVRQRTLSSRSRTISYHPAHVTTDEYIWLANGRKKGRLSEPDPSSPWQVMPPRLACSFRGVRGGEGSGTGVGILLGLICGSLSVKDIVRFDDRYSTILRQMS